MEAHASRGEGAASVVKLLHPALVVLLVCWDHACRDAKWAVLSPTLRRSAASEGPRKCNPGTLATMPFYAKGVAPRGNANGTSTKTSLVSGGTHVSWFKSREGHRTGNKEPVGST